MKQSDINQGRRLARLIDQLTRDGKSTVTINFDGEVPRPCSIGVRQFTPLSDEKTFTGSTVIGCLLDALKSRGLTEETPPDDGSEYETQLGERAKIRETQLPD